MPVEIEEGECTQADGTEGSWRIVKKSDGSLEACATTREDAVITAVQINRAEGEPDAEI
jgi:hypothetical protein